MEIKNEIERMLKNTLEKMEVDFQGSFNLEHPQYLKNGDWTTNIALRLAGKAGKNPREFAEQIRAQIEPNKNIEKIEVAGPGYLNFYLSPLFYYECISKIGRFAGTDNEIYPIKYKNFEKKEKNQKILLEHSSPNLFKPFHIGHMVNNAIGESLGRIFKFLGYELRQISFPSDVGPGIAKTVWALKEQKKNIETLTLQEIADAYVKGVAEYKENEEVKKEIDQINIDIYNYLYGEKNESEEIKYYQKGRDLSLEHFKEITQKLGSHFDEMIFESQAEVLGKEIVRKNIPEVFKEVENEDGSKTVIFEGKNYTNVFINSQGFGTYLTKDIGLLKIKKERYSEVEKSFVVTDVEQKQHFEMVKEAGEKIAEISDFVQKSEYLQHGRMNFSGKVKISSRYGNVPLALDVISKVQENLLEKMVERDFTEEEKKLISERIAIATLKYSILKVTSGKNISFDVEKDTDPQGNSAPYIIYALVRAKSIFNQDLAKQFLNEMNNRFYLEKNNLMIKVCRFSKKVQESFELKSPHVLANYAYDLAQEFNKFYAETKILDEKEKNKTFLYLQITSSFINVMEKSLELLGIKPVEKM